MLARALVPPPPSRPMAEPVIDRPAEVRYTVDCPRHCGTEFEVTRDTRTNEFTMPDGCDCGQLAPIAEGTFEPHEREEIQDRCTAENESGRRAL